MTQTAALIVAAGRGTRAGPGCAKQWRALAGKRVIDWTIAGLSGMPRASTGSCWSCMPTTLAGFTPPNGVELCTGGATRAGVGPGRAQSVGSQVDKVLIHDVARPCVPQSVISSVLEALDDAPGAAPALPVTDALWRGAWRQGDRDTGPRRAFPGPDAAGV